MPSKAAKAGRGGELNHSLWQFGLIPVFLMKMKEAENVR